MLDTGLMSAGCRCKTGAIRVRKDHGHLKPMLGNYHCKGQRNPVACYTRQNLAWAWQPSQPAQTGDIDWLKKKGFAVPGLREISFGDQYVRQRWSTPFGYPVKEKRQKKMKKPQKRPPVVPLPPDRTFSVTGPSEAQITRDFEKEWRRKVDAEFRKTLIVLKCHRELNDYLKRKSASEGDEEEGVPFDEWDDDGLLLEEAKRMAFAFRTASAFRANPVPWKSFIRPLSFTTVATRRSSHEKLPEASNMTVFNHYFWSFIGALRNRLRGNREYAEDVCKHASPGEGQYL